MSLSSILFRCFLVLACLCIVNPSEAGTIAITLDIKATGSLGSQTFQNALLSFMLIEDSTQVQVRQNIESIAYNLGPATFNIESVGSGIIQDTFNFIVASYGRPTFSIESVMLGKLWFDSVNGYAAIFDLTRPNPPVSGLVDMSHFSPPTVEPTTLGDLKITAEGAYTISTSEVTSVTPEPTSFSFLALSTAVVGFGRCTLLFLSKIDKLRPSAGADCL